MDSVKFRQKTEHQVDLVLRDDIEHPGCTTMGHQTGAATG